MILKKVSLLFLLFSLNTAFAGVNKVASNPLYDPYAYELSLWNCYKPQDRKKIQSLTIRVDQSFIRCFNDLGQKIRVTDFPNLAHITISVDYAGLYERFETTDASMHAFNEWMSTADSLTRPLSLEISSNFKINPIKSVTNLTIYEHKTLDSSLYGFPNLKSLSLNGDFVTDFEFSNYTHLKTLYINAPNIKQIDLSEISILESLEWLSINLNSVESVDLTPLINNQYLKNLFLYLPQLTTFDFRMLTMNRHLMSLNLHSDSLTELIMPLKKMSSMSDMIISSSKLRTIPTGFSNFSEIKSLTLTTPNLDSISPDFFETSLISLDIEKSSLAQIPPEIGQLTDLFHLLIAVKDAKGDYSFFANLTQLEQLIIMGPSNFRHGLVSKYKDTDHKAIRHLKKVLPKSCSVFVSKKTVSDIVQ